jgi:wyosine [tRNA(Phe)-imidazoG37] synthetase (radical SAM superfamily)
MSDMAPLPDWVFRDLDAAGEEEFREYARTHDPRDWNQWCCSHPVCRDEWTKLGKALTPPPEEN